MSQPDEVVLQTSAATAVTTRNYRDVDAYADAREIHFYRGEGAQHITETIPLQPPQTDTQQSRHEIPSALGRYFAQGNFTLGSQQPYFDEGPDPDVIRQAKFLYSEGFDISEAGVLRHLHAVLTANGGALTAGSTGRMAICQGYLFVPDGTNLRRYDPITGAVTVIDPHNGEAATTVHDVTAAGDRLYVALGVNGIHLSDDAGANFAHHNDAQAIRVAWLKDRLVAAAARSFYEITASGAAPSDKQPLQAGWTYTDIGENGPFIYAPCIHESSALSKVFHFGLDNSLAVTVQGSSWLPNDELVYCIKGYLGIVLLGCGKVNDEGGKDARLYKAVPNDDGFLEVQLIAESEGAGTRDLAPRGIATDGRNFLVGWTLGTDSPFGEREGIAKYDPALDAFSHHLASSTDTTTPEHVLGVIRFEGRIVFTTIDGVYYEDVSKYVAQATLISSTSTFRNPGLKKWDESALTTKPLPATASVELDYSTIAPEEQQWSIAGEHTTADGTEASFTHRNVESPRLTVRLVSNANSGQTDAPEIESFSVRVNPTVENTEYRLVRTVEIKEKHAKQRRANIRYYDPRAERDALRALVNDFINWYEADTPQGYNVRLVNVREINAVTDYATTNGESAKEQYILVLEMHGRVN